MKKWTIPLFVGLFLGCVVGIILGLFALDILNISPKEDATYGVLEIVYYLVAPIGVLATLLAVTVALWGNEFKNYLFREKSVSSVSNAFTEVLKDEDDTNPESSRYECNLSVKNICSREIAECCVFLIDGHYRENDNSKPKRITPNNRVPIFWKYPEAPKKNITPEETVDLTLLKIFPDISQSRSDSSGSTTVPRHLSIVGLKNINQRLLRKGYWELTYCVSNSHRELERFKIIVNWTGEWKSREKEMGNEATIEFKRIN